MLTILLLSFIGGGDTLSRLGYMRSESSTIIVEEPEAEAEKTSEKEDANSSEGSTGIICVCVCAELQMFAIPGIKCTT